MSGERKEVNVIDPVKRQLLIEEAKRSALEAKDKHVILFVGPTGSGKSTTINDVANCKMEVVDVDDDDQPRFQVVANTSVAATGNGRKSKTLFPQVIKANNLQLVDCAGFGENRGQEEIHTANIGLKEVIRNAESIRGVVVCVEYGSLKVQRSEGLTNLISILSQLIKEPGKLSVDEKKGITFIITKIPMGLKRVKLKALLQNIKNDLKEEGTKEAVEQSELMNLMQESNVLMIRTDGTGSAPDTDNEMDLEANRQFIIKTLSNLPAVGLKPENFILSRPESEVAREAEYFEARTNLNVLSRTQESSFCNLLTFPEGVVLSNEQKQLKTLHQALRKLQDNLFLMIKNRLAIVNKEPDVKLDQEGLEQHFNALIALFEKSVPTVSSDTFQYLANTIKYLTQFQKVISTLFKEDKLGDDILQMIDKVIDIQTVLHNQLSKNGLGEFRKTKKSASTALKHVHDLVNNSQERLSTLERDKTEMIRRDTNTEGVLTADVDLKQRAVNQINIEVPPVVTASVPGTQPTVLAVPAVPAMTDPGPQPTSYTEMAAYLNANPNFLKLNTGITFGIPSCEIIPMPSLDICNQLLTIRHTFDHSCGALHDPNEQRKLDDLLNNWENKYKVNWRLVFDIVYRSAYVNFGNWFENKGGKYWYSFPHMNIVGYHDKKAAYDASVAAYNSWLSNKNTYEAQTAALNNYIARKSAAEDALNNAKTALSNHQRDAAARLDAINIKISNEKTYLARVKFVRLLTMGFTKALDTITQSPHSENAHQLVKGFIASIEPYTDDLPEQFWENLKKTSSSLLKEKKRIDRIYKEIDLLEDQNLKLVFDKTKSFDKQLTEVNNKLQFISLNYNCKLSDFVKLCQELYLCKSLKTLNLSGAEINNQKLDELFAALRVLPQIRILDLSKNKLDDKAAMSLLALVYAHPGLAEIRLEENQGISPSVLALIRGALLLKHRLRGESPEKITEKLDKYLAAHFHAVELLSLKKDDLRVFTVSGDGPFEAKHDPESGKLKFAPTVDQAKKTRHALHLSTDLSAETQRETQAFFMRSDMGSKVSQTGIYQNTLGRTFWSGTAASNQSSAANPEQHWYTHQEVHNALSGQVQAHNEMMVLTPISAAQINGATLRDNLGDVLRIGINPEVNGGAAHSRFLIPLNMGGGSQNSAAGIGDSHWVMLYLDVRNRSTPVLRYVDPYGRAIDTTILNAVNRALTENHLGQAQFQHSEIVHQRDGFNCGPWIIEIGQYLADHDGQLPPANFIADINARRAAQQEALRNDSGNQVTVNHQSPSTKRH